jgi:MFS family permease
MRMFTRETFVALRNRNFRLFFGGQLISQAGNWLTLVALSLFVLKLTDSGVAVGVLTGCMFAPVLLFGAFGGLIADRSDKRKLLIGVQTFAMIQSFALAMVATMDDPPLALIYGLAAAGGFVLAFENPARRAFVNEMVPEKDLNNAISLNSAVMTASRVVGPAIAGLLIGTVGYAWCFALDGISYIAVIIAYIRMNPELLRRAPVTERGKGQIRAGLRYVRTVPELWISILMLAVIGTLSFNFQTVMPLLIKRTFDGTDQTFTWFFSIVSIGSLVGALATARRSVGGLRNLAVTSMGFGISMLALSIAPSLWLTFPIGIAIGYTSIGFMVAGTAIVQLRADPAMRGRVLALQAIVFLGSTPIGGPILGVICEAFGPRTGVAVGGIAAVGAAAFGVVAARRTRDIEGDVALETRQLEVA